MVSRSMIQLVTSPDPNLIDIDLTKFIIPDEMLYRKKLRNIIPGKVTILKSDFNAERYEVTLNNVREIVFQWNELLGEHLNKKFSIPLSKKEWKFILFPFLWFFIWSVYIKYEKFLKIKDMDITITLYPGNRICKTAAVNRTLLLASFDYNAMIWADILEFFDKEVKEKEQLEFVDKSACVKLENTKKYSKVLKRCSRALGLLFREPKAFGKRLLGKFSDTKEIPLYSDKKSGVGLISSRMPEKFENELFHRSKGEIEIINEAVLNYEPECLDGEIDIKGRASLLSEISFENEFDNLLKNIIPKYLPISHFEEILKYYQRAQQLCQDWNYRKLYHSGTSSELFLFISAVLSKKNTLICDIQHAGGYSGNYYCGSVEYCVFDRFLTWGWSGEGEYGNFRAVAMNRIPVKPWYKVNQKDKILLVATSESVVTDQYMGVDFSHCTSRQIEFIDNLPEELRKKLVIRLRTYDKEPDLWLECKEKYPYIVFENIVDISITDSLLESALVVCDSYSTTHFEAIMLGCPFVMFESTPIIRYRPTALQYLEKMSTVGIYKENGAELAKEISKHHNYNEWLKTGDEKRIIEEYKTAMTGGGNNIFEAWYQELIGD